MRRIRRVMPGFNRPAMAAAIASLLAACAPAFPPIADGLSGDAAFKARIATLYPVGSSGPVLGADLARQGFVLTGDAAVRRYAAISAPDNLPCFSLTRIRWSEDRRGRITRVTAERHICS